MSDKLNPNVFSSEIVKKYFNITQEIDFDLKKQVLMTYSLSSGLVVKAGLDDYEQGSVMGALQSTYNYIWLVEPQLVSIDNPKKFAELKKLQEYKGRIKKYINTLPSSNDYQQYVNAILTCQEALGYIVTKFPLFGLTNDQPIETEL